MLKKAKWYVYELADPVTELAFYVGKGTGNRINAHEREAYKGVCSKKCNKIKSITNSGKCIIKRKIASFWNEQDAYDYETDLISFYGLKNLTNIMPGGQVAFDRRVLEKGKREINPVPIIRGLSNHIITWIKDLKCGERVLICSNNDEGWVKIHNELTVFFYNDLLPGFLKAGLNSPRWGNDVQKELSKIAGLTYVGS